MAENRLFDEIEIGDEASAKRVCTANDLYVFAHASGNLNPLHLPETEGEAEAVAPSMWVGGLISAVLGNILPGPGTLYRGQSLRFYERAHVGDELTVTVTVTGKADGGLVTLDSKVTRSDGIVLADGEAEVLAPPRKIVLEGQEVPSLLVNRHSHFDALLEKCRGLPALRTAVVCPDEEKALAGALLARDRGLMEPILVGARAGIEVTARSLGAQLDGTEIIDVTDHAEAAARAVALVHEGQAAALMKGHLHTDELLRAVVRSQGGLRTSRRLSHVFVMDVPGLDSLLLVTDAAINIAPSLEEKVDIVQNAIHLAHSLGIEHPKVGVLSAVETVNPKIPSTLDAAILSKMAERGQIMGGSVDGPLAMDNAVDMEAAKTKGITSLVAGRADILAVPNLEAGNMLAKELAFIAHAEAAGLVLGAKVPIMLTSRADGDKARLASCAVALLYENWLTGGGTEATRRAAE